MDLTTDVVTLRFVFFHAHCILNILQKKKKLKNSFAAFSFFTIVVLFVQFSDSHRRRGQTKLHQRLYRKESPDYIMII